MEVIILAQGELFLLAIIWGFLLSVGYDLWMGICSPKHWWREPFYGAFSGVLFFLFAQREDEGRIRSYLLLGWLIGMLIYFLLCRSSVQKGILRWRHFLKKVKKLVRMLVGRR